MKMAYHKSQHEVIRRDISWPKVSEISIHGTYKNRYIAYVDDCLTSADIMLYY